MATSSRKRGGVCCSMLPSPLQSPSSSSAALAGGVCFCGMLKGGGLGMRDKCGTCEYWRSDALPRSMAVDPQDMGRCHIRSVPSDTWPSRIRRDFCGEHSALQADPPVFVPIPLASDIAQDVHQSTRVEKSMGVDDATTREKSAAFREWDRRFRAALEKAGLAPCP